MCKDCEKNINFIKDSKKMFKFPHLTPVKLIENNLAEKAQWNEWGCIVDFIDVKNELKFISCKMQEMFCKTWGTKNIN